MKKWNYYNDTDPKVCAWAKELIKAKLVPDGEVDCRSIEDVRPDEIKDFVQCHFFCGILGWSLALRLAGWPDDRPVWTGSCPCQPFSTAGKGLAQADERHLWPVFFNLIRQCRPEHVFGEQVASAIGHGWLDGISTDLEGEGYACGAAVLGAHSVKSPHQRQRLYWVADAGHMRWRDGAIPSKPSHDETARRCEERGLVISKREGSQGLSFPRGADSSDGRGEGFGESPAPSCQVYDGVVLTDSDGCSAGSSAATTTGHGNTIEPAGFWDDSRIVHCRDGKTRRIPTEPAFFPLAHGIPARVVRLRGYGNAIVPECAKIFIEAFLDIQK